MLIFSLFHNKKTHWVIGLMSWRRFPRSVFSEVYFWQLFDFFLIPIIIIWFLLRFSFEWERMKTLWYPGWGPRPKIHMSRPSQAKHFYVQTAQTERTYVQTFMRSKISVRSSCVQKCVCPDYRAFKVAYVQTIVGSFVCPDRVILNARHPLLRSFRSGHINFRSGTSACVPQFYGFSRDLLIEFFF